MRFNSMVKDNDRKKDYFSYIVLAIVFGFIVYVFLNIVVKVLVTILGLFLKRWYVVIISVFIFLLIKKFLGKKKK